MSAAGGHACSQRLQYALFSYAKKGKNTAGNTLLTEDFQGLDVVRGELGATQGTLRNLLASLFIKSESQSSASNINQPVPARSAGPSTGHTVDKGRPANPAIRVNRYHLVRLGN